MTEWRLSCPLMQLLVTPVRSMLLTNAESRIVFCFLLMLMGIAFTLSLMHSGIYVYKPSATSPGLSFPTPDTL